MPLARLDDVEIWYETSGDPSAPAIVLLPGLGDQLVWWDEVIVEGLAHRGYYVVRCDPRDVGLSTKFDRLEPDPWGRVARLLGGEPTRGPYSVEDMATDVIRLIEELNLGRVHVFGSSFGGAIAHWIGINAPARVRTITTLGSNTGNREVPGPTLSSAALQLLVSPPPRTRAGFVEYRLKVLRFLSYSPPPFAEDYQRKREGAAFDRSDDYMGRGRQLLASMTESSTRTQRLPELQMPILHIHGKQDALVNPEFANDLQRLVPGARVELLEHTGHLVHPTCVHGLVDLVWEFIAAHR